MKKYLLRISFIASLVCGFLLGSTVKAQGAVAERQHDKQQIKQYDGWIHQLAEEPETAPVSALRPLSPSHRVASHRSVRLLPTHGGKPSHNSGRWGKGQLSNLPKCFVQLSCIGHHQPSMAVSSPRGYYVIALRRLLC